MLSSEMVKGLARSKLKLPEFCMEAQVDMSGSVTMMVLLG